MLLAGGINSISQYPKVQAALKGINVAVAALLTSVIVKFAKKTIKNVWNALFMCISFVCIFWFKVPSFIIILAAIVIGCLNTARVLKKEKAAAAEQTVAELPQEEVK